MPSGMLMGGQGHAAPPFNEYFCVIGTSTVECSFDLTVYFYDSEQKGEEMGDYAVVNETLTIAVPSGEMSYSVS